MALDEVEHQLIEWGYGPPPQKPEEAQAPAEEQPQPAEVH